MATVHSGDGPGRSQDAGRRSGPGEPKARRQVEVRTPQARSPRCFELGGTGIVTCPSPATQVRLQPPGGRTPAADPTPAPWLVGFRRRAPPWFLAAPLRSLPWPGGDSGVVALAHRPGARAGSGARSGTPPPTRRRGRRRRGSGPRRQWLGRGPPGAARAGPPARLPPAARVPLPSRRSNSSLCAHPRTPDPGSSRGPRSPGLPQTLPRLPSRRAMRPRQGGRQLSEAGVASRAAPLSRAPAARLGPRGRCAVPGGAPARRGACRFNKPRWDW